jgi:hypothetical protein
MVKGTFWKNSKELSHFKEESYEMAKIFGGFGLDFQLSSFEIAIYLSKFRF